MRKLILVFVIAILIPSLVLAVLAIRGLQDQQFVLERQQALLTQELVDGLVRDVNNRMLDMQAEFSGTVQGFLEDPDAMEGGRGFDRYVEETFALASVGFAINEDGVIVSPPPFRSAQAEEFLEDNELFLLSGEQAAVYTNILRVKLGGAAQVQPEPAEKEAADSLKERTKSPAPQRNLLQEDFTSGAQEFDATPETPGAAVSQSSLPPDDVSPAVRDHSFKRSSSENYDLPQAVNELAEVPPMPPLPPPLESNRRSFTKASQIQLEQQRLNEPEIRRRRIISPNPPLRRVIPKRQDSQGESPQQISRVQRVQTEFSDIVEAAPEGILARLRDENLQLIVWFRSTEVPGWIFGAQLDIEKVRRRLASEVYMDENLRSELALALLDQTGEPVAVSLKGFVTDWRRPFVASEVGEVLPFWEAAIYQVNPQRLKESADTVRYSLGSLVLLLIGIIGLGSAFITRDINRQVRAARQKTDFVSNVSHELKTPLTSIRMFSELLSSGTVTDDEKRRSYLHIIEGESARLSRLIDGVLDFAKLERGEKSYPQEPLNLVEVTRETAEVVRPSLEAAGMQVELQLPEEPLYVEGNIDGLSQIIVNLLSNCEKYAAAGKSVTVQVKLVDGFAVLRVLDRGPGVPRGLEAKIFEQFFRVDDNLSSGKQGSGLGLALARQIAQALGGSLTYAPRKCGGAAFSLKLPLTSPKEPRERIENE